MRELLYTIFYIGRSEKLGKVCFTLFMIGLFLQVCVCGHEPVEDYHDLLIFIIPTIPWLFIGSIVVRPIYFLLKK